MFDSIPAEPSSSTADANNEVKRYRAIWISDLHLGTPGCQAEKLLETCKKSIRISLETDRYMQDAVINKYLADLRKGLDRDLRKDVYDHIDKISYKELQQFAKENISNKPYTYCIVGSEKKINIDSLAKYGTVKKISLEEIFGY